MTSTRRSLIAATIIVFTIFTDWITKQWALSALSDGHRIPLLPTLEFDLLFNNGFSFGTGEGRGRLIGIGVIGMVVYLAVQLHRATIVHRVVFFSIILGGAIGNLLDRIFRADDGFLTGSVVDFIDVSWFAVFNVADIYVVCGAIAFGLWETLINPQLDAPEQPADERDPTAATELDTTPDPILDTDDHSALQE
ncbi:MAG: signal peptidase II [Acidimicrobiales bacterium]